MTVFLYLICFADVGFFIVLALLKLSRERATKAIDASSQLVACQKPLTAEEELDLLLAEEELSLTREIEEAFHVAIAVKA